MIKAQFWLPEIGDCALVVNRAEQSCLLLAVKWLVIRELLYSPRSFFERGLYVNVLIIRELAARSAVGVGEWGEYSRRAQPGTAASGDYRHQQPTQPGGPLTGRPAPGPRERAQGPPACCQPRMEKYSSPALLATARSAPAVINIP